MFRLFIFMTTTISILTVSTLPSNISEWSCAKNVTGKAFQIEKMSGEWYEAARLPPSEVPACVKVIAPDAIQNETYNLKLNYINNVNKNWKPTTENLEFPWNNATKNGIFEITYGNEEVNMKFTFKIVEMHYDQIALICYYSNYIPSLNMLKIMTRVQKVNPETINSIQKLADKSGYGSQITFVEQSSKCNNANAMHRLAPLALLIKFLVLNKIF